MAQHETRPGRRRDPSRDEAILGATLDLLGEVGYEGVTIRAIAERAGVGLATMYRRWPTKQALVIDAVASVDPTAQVPSGGDPAENLRVVAAELVDLLTGKRRGMVPSLVSQLSRDPELAEALRARIVGPRLANLVTLVRALPGVNPDRVEDAAELLVATLFFRTLLRGLAVSDDDLRRIVETVTICATAP